jgi:hypothetical protein
MVHVNNANGTFLLSLKRTLDSRLDARRSLLHHVRSEDAGSVRSGGP